MGCILGVEIIVLPPPAPVMFVGRRNLQDLDACGLHVAQKPSPIGSCRLNADALKVSKGTHPGKHLPLALSRCRKALGSEHLVPFVDNSGDVKILVRVNTANNDTGHRLLTNFHAGSPGQSLDRRFTETRCLDRTVTRQDVRPFLFHMHRRGKPHRKAFPGGR
jgi:hypothetical protein